MRKKDLFITDSQLNIIEDFFSEPQIQIEDWEDNEKTEIDRIVDKLNEGVIDEL